jgi:hypothetical protein
LIVQVVDPSWLPLGGAEVTVYSTRNRKKESKVAHTMDDGDAKFWIPGEPGDADYTIEANYGGFKTKRLKRRAFGRSFKLKPDCLCSNPIVATGRTADNCLLALGGQLMGWSAAETL